MTGGLGRELADILSVVVTQLRALTDDEVKAIVSGDAEFRLVPRAAARPARSRSDREPAVSTVETNRRGRDRTEPAKAEAAKAEAAKSAATKSAATKSEAAKSAPTKAGGGAGTVNTATVRDALSACRSETEALDYLRGLRLSPAAAKALAGELGLRLPARPSVTSISAEIVRVFVGGRLNAATVQRL